MWSVDNLSKLVFEYFDTFGSQKSITSETLVYKNLHENFAAWTITAKSTKPSQATRGRDEQCFLTSDFDA